jgi:lysophospholipase L1-like esterase
MVGNRAPLAALLALVVSLAGCRDDGVGPTPDDPLFERYVALGNSITAGFESEGINDSTQAHPYSVQFAARFNAPFAWARVRLPGCPAPLVGPLALTTERVGGARATDCAGLHTTLPRLNHSLAVPGARIADALREPVETDFSPYNLFIRLLFREIFGGRTLVQAMVNADPTLVSVWLGNNDVLTAATSGNVAEMTATASFIGSLDQIVSAIADQTGAQDAILLGVGNPLLIPLVQPGLYFWVLAQDPAGHALIGNKPVSANCGPDGAGRANLVSARVVRAAATEISCADDAPFVINPEEQAAITAQVQEYNEAIQARAAAHGWIYIDVPAIQQAQIGDPQGIRLCQDLLAAQTVEGMFEAVRETCPLPRDDPRDFFGRLFSFDGFHPSREGQEVIADHMEAAVRAKHGL